MLDRLVARHKELRQLQLPLLHTATDSRSTQKAAMDEAVRELKGVKREIGKLAMPRCHYWLTCETRFDVGVLQIQHSQS